MPYMDAMGYDFCKGARVFLYPHLVFIQLTAAS